MTSMDPQQSSVIKNTRHFFSGTLLSRVSGMLRDMSMAAVFGDHPSVAAFMVAFRFSHFFRRLLGEGALQSLFIPHYEELRLHDESKANAFFFRLSVLCVILLISIVFLGEITAKISSYFSASNEILRLFAWMLPSLLFICLYGLNTSLLQCQSAFFTASIAPFACNLIWITAIFLCSKKDMHAAMVQLSLCTMLGFAIQWLITMPKTWHTLKKGKQALSTPLFCFPTEIRSIGKATCLGLIGIAAVQINSFLDMLFARSADLKGPVYLWYAIRLEQLPLALIGLACVYSITPTLSRLIKAQDLDKVQELFLFGYRRIVLFIVPCIFALFALGFVSVNLLFGRGHFSQDAVVETTLCLWAYGLSLLSSTLTVYFSSLFYAYKDFKTPPLASVISVGANILLNTLFVFFFHWKATSIAISTSLCSWLNYEILRKTFMKRAYWAIEIPHAGTLWKLWLIGAISLLACLGIDQLFFHTLFFQAAEWILPRTLTHQILHFAGQFLIFISVFTLGFFLLCREMFSSLRKII